MMEKGGGRDTMGDSFRLLHFRQQKEIHPSSAREIDFILPVIQIDPSVTE